MFQQALVRFALCHHGSGHRSARPSGLRKLPRLLKAGIPSRFPKSREERGLPPRQVQKGHLFVNHSDASFLSGYTEYAKNFDLAVELQADIDAFVKSIGAKSRAKKDSLLTPTTGAYQIDFVSKAKRSPAALLPS